MRVALGVLASLAVAGAQHTNLRRGEECSDSCDGYNFDGDCDDGGTGAEYALCSFGEDCTDCDIRNPGGIAGGFNHAKWCIPRDSFVWLNFNGASLYRSNIGGQGGRCWMADQCDEQLVDTDATDIGLVAGANTVHEMYIRNIEIGRASCR